MKTKLRNDEEKTLTLLKRALLAISSAYALNYLGWPLDADGSIAPFAAFAAALFVVSAAPLSAVIASKLADAAEKLAARIPSKTYGEASWITSLRQFGRDRKRLGWGAYWGVLKGKAVIADYESVALTVGPPGSSKSVGVVEPNALAIRTSKIITDFKGSLAVKLSSALRDRGEKVLVLNLGDIFSDRLGPSECYNVLLIVAECFERPGGIGDAPEDATEIALQLNPESESSGQDNRFFRDGQRMVTVFATLITVLIDGRNAHLGDVLNLLADRQNLARHAKWVAGLLIEENANGEPGAPIPFPLEEAPWIHLHAPDQIRAFKTYLSGLGASVADILEGSDSRYADSFLTGAQNALAPFKATTKASQVMRSSTFRFRDLREQVSTVFIVADASRISSSQAVIGLIQWAALTELIRSPDHNRPVTLLADEATNFLIHDLPKMLSWARGYGVRIHIIIQFLSAFRQAYGQNGLEALLNAAEIIQFLPGQSEKTTLEIIKAMLGERSVVTETRSGASGLGAEGISGLSYSETGRPLLTEDQIRRLRKTILFLRHHKPALVDLPPSAAISPFRDQLAGDPFHGGKAWKKPVKLRLQGRDGPWPLRLALKAWRNRHQADPK